MHADGYHSVLVESRETICDNVPQLLVHSTCHAVVHVVHYCEGVSMPWSERERIAVTPFHTCCESSSWSLGCYRDIYTLIKMPCCQMFYSHCKSITVVTVSTRPPNHDICKVVLKLVTGGQIQPV